MKADIVRLLIENGADVATHDETHSTPLHLAAYCGSTETVRLLIKHGSDVTAQDRSNRTPLHLALSTVSSGYASFIIYHRLNESGQNGSVAMRHYEPDEKVGTIRLLIEHGADITAQDETHTTPLHLATTLGVPEIVQLLIECGADVTAQDWRHRTPLHMASSWVSAKTTFLLI
jgi:ankyrin repeat protein